jgi:hypothetical protein
MTAGLPYSLVIDGLGWTVALVLLTLASVAVALVLLGETWGLRRHFSSSKKPEKSMN